MSNACLVPKAARGKECDSLSVKVKGNKQFWRSETSCEFKSCDLKGQTGLSRAMLFKMAFTNHTDIETLKCG